MGSAARRHRRSCVLGIWAILLFTTGLAAASQPTAAGIVSGWATLSGKLGGKVVYSQDSKIRVLDLQTGASSAIATYDWTSGGQPPLCKWSPDGKRILWNKGDGAALMVMNADGSNLSEVGQSGPLWGSGWSGNDWVVHSTGNKIMRTQLNAQNQAINTAVVVDQAPAGASYDGVEMFGDFVSYIDVEANIPSGGYHRGVVRNVKSGEVLEVIPRNSDSCAIRQKPDGSGTTIFHQEDHWSNAVILDFQGQRIGEMPPLPGRRISFIRWSNHVDFLAHNDWDFYAPDNTQRAWIRKVSTQENLFLGENLWTPDLWVGAAGSNPTPGPVDPGSDNPSQGPLDPPTQLKATPVASSRLALEWRDNSSSEEGFRVYRDEGAGFLAIATAGTNNAAFLDDGVVEGKTYTYRVVAFQANKESAPSNEVVIIARAPYVLLLSPKGGERLRVGEMLEVKWETNMPAFNATIRLSVDGKRSWQIVAPSLTIAGSSWTWKVGTSSTDARLVSASSKDCFLRVEDYQGTPVVDINAAPFEIRMEGEGGSFSSGCASAVSGRHLPIADEIPLLLPLFLWALWRRSSRPTPITSAIISWRARGPRR